MFSLRHFMIFKAVSDTGSFTKAAQQLYITQSAVSHAIRELEEYTDTVLFDRLSRQIRLTAAGKLLLEEITPILASCEALDRRIGRLDIQAPLSVVSSITIASFYLPRFLLKLKKQMPEASVHVRVVSAAEAVKVLRAGHADIALIEGVLPQGPFHYRRFADYSLEIVCTPDYALPALPMSMEAFCAEKLLLREPGSAIRDALDSRLLLAGHTVQPIWVSVNSTALLEAAKAGLGITVLPKMLTADALSEKALRTVDVEGLSLANDLTAVWHREKYLSPVLLAFLSCIG